MIKIITFLTFAFISCSKTTQQPHVEIINKLMKQTSKEITCDHPNISTIGYGGRMMGDLQTVFLHFECREDVDICKARLLYVECSERIKDTINSNADIEPYLHTSPFTKDETDIMLHFVDSSGRFVSKDNCVAAVLYAKSNIIYLKYDPKLPFGKDLVEIYKEPYEEALRIYQCELNVN